MRERCKVWHDQVVDPVHRDVFVLAELEDDCVRRRKAGCSAGVASDMSRIQVGSGRNSRIHGSQSSSFACARVSSGSLFCACVIGSASAAVGSACLPAVRTRTYADVEASACGGMAVMQRHACNSVVSGGFLPVQKSTSYNVGTGRQGPTGTRRVKGGVSGLAEDLHPVSEVEAGVNFRPASGVRVPFPGGNQAQVPGVSGMVRSHLPSTRRFLVSNSCHLDTDWKSGNRWAGRRCVEPHGRGFGC